MSFVEQAGIRYFQFESLAKFPVKHGVVTRHGGVSPMPWSSLNIGSTVGDDLDNVLTNKMLMLKGAGIDEASVFDAWQVHGKEIICTSSPRNPSAELQQADGILTNTPGVALLMRFADCTPILLYDPVRKVIGIVHAGWMGTVKRIPAEAVRKMSAVYQTAAKDIIACIGPSIGPEDYEVGSEVIDAVKASFKERSREVLSKEQNGHAYFDLWQANEISLRESGVKQVEIAGISTYSNTQDWFSHRNEKGKTGRFGAFIALS